MAKSIYFVNCIGAIRHTTYGRDNRKPIADAITELKMKSDKEGWSINPVNASVVQISQGSDSYILDLSTRT